MTKYEPSNITCLGAAVIRAYIYAGYTYRRRTFAGQHCFNDKSLVSILYYNGDKNNSPRGVLMCSHATAYAPGMAKYSDGIGRETVNQTFGETFAAREFAHGSPYKPEMMIGKRGQESCLTISKLPEYYIT